MKDVAKSVKHRLRSLREQNGRTAEELDNLYVMERFLYRLSCTKYKEEFILKGGVLQFVWFGNIARSTKDIDVTSKMFLDAISLRQIIEEIATVEVEEDGLLFDIESLTVRIIKSEQRYGGFRAEISCLLGKSSYRLTLDSRP